MEDLLKSQIHGNCKLALPEGLKDLMSDISREVLRTQPQDLYQFIANYLGALLEARETLSIACKVCSDICKCTCDQIKQELYNELRKINLGEKDIENAIEIIEKHLKGDKKDSVKEDILLLKFLRKTNIDQEQLPKIQQAVQKAFKRESVRQRDLMNFLNENINKGNHYEAVLHTLQLYKQNKSKEQNETKELFVCSDFKPSITTVSSTSLAGSFIRLPKHRPYSAHDKDTMSTISERERLSIDYTKYATTTKINPKIEISRGTTFVKVNNNEEYKSYDDDNSQNEDKMTNARFNNKTEINEIATTGETNDKENIIEVDKYSTPLYENSDEMTTNDEDEYSDDEVQEFIENEELENESNASSVVELLQNDVNN